MQSKSSFIGRGPAFLAALILIAFPKITFAVTSANLLLNPDASIGTGIDPGTVADWTIGGDTNPGRDDGTFDGFIPPASQYDFYGGESVTGGPVGDQGSLSQVVNLLATGTGLSATDIDAGKDSFNVSFYEQSLDQSSNPDDQAQVIITFQNASQTTIAGGYNSGPIDNIGGWLLVDPPAVAIPAGARFMTYEMLFTLQVGLDVDSFIASNDLTTTTGAVSSTPSPVPLPSAAWSALGLLGLLAGFQYLRRRRAAA
jgi:hypothetical protein